MIIAEIILAALIAGAMDTFAGIGGTLFLLPVLVSIGGASGSKSAVMLTAIISIGWNLVRVALLKSWVQWNLVVRGAIGAVVGSAIGIYAYTQLTPDLLRILIGALLIIVGAYYVVRLYTDVPEPAGNKRLGMIPFGFIGGLVSGAIGGGNELLQTFGFLDAGITVRESMASSGALGGIIGIIRTVGYAVTGSLTPALLLFGIVGLAAGAVGAYVALRLSQKGKDSTLELVLGGTLILAGIRTLL